MPFSDRAKLALSLSKRPRAHSPVAPAIGGNHEGRRLAPTHAARREAMRPPLYCANCGQKFRFCTGCAPLRPMYMGQTRYSVPVAGDLLRRAGDDGANGGFAGLTSRGNDYRRRSFGGRRSGRPWFGEGEYRLAGAERRPCMPWLGEGAVSPRGDIRVRLIMAPAPAAMMANDAPRLSSIKSGCNRCVAHESCARSGQNVPK